jgi:hypothetical protein
MSELDTTDGILYYPTIEFQDETWLKGALCTWERVYRIVPAEYVPMDSSAVRRAVDEGLIADINLSRDELELTAKLFMKFWQEIPFVPSGLDSHHLETRLNVNKVDVRIQPLLRSMALQADREWLHLPPGVANGYMLFLSEIVSRRRAIPKLTDNADFFAIAHYFANDGNMDEAIYNPEATEVTAAMVLSTVLPCNLEFCTMEDILKFRSKSEEGRAAFRQAVSQCISDISRVSERDHAIELAQQLQHKLAVARVGLIDSVKRFLPDVAYAAVAVGMPATLTALPFLAGSGDPFDMHTLVGAGLIGVVAALADAGRTRRKQWTSREALYYLQLKDVTEVAGKVHLTIPSFHHLLDEFVND